MFRYALILQTFCITNVFPSTVWLAVFWDWVWNFKGVLDYSCPPLFSLSLSHFPLLQILCTKVIWLGLSFDPIHFMTSYKVCIIISWETAPSCSFLLHLEFVVCVFSLLKNTEQVPHLAYDFQADFMDLSGWNNRRSLDYLPPALK